MNLIVGIFLIGGVSTVSATPGGGTPQCTVNGSPVSVQDVCLSRNAAEAEAECVARAAQFTQQSLSAVCAPQAAQICRPLVQANADAYCGDYLNVHVQDELNLRMGDIINICGDRDFANLAVKMSDVSARCRQSQDQSQVTQQTCTDSYTLAQNIAQSVSAVCQPTNLTSLKCPDLQPACAAWRYRRFPDGVYRPVKCKRWVTVSVTGSE